MNEKKRLNLSLSMAQPFHRLAWEIITAIPDGQRTDAVCQTIVQYGMLETIQDSIRIALREVMQEMGCPCAAFPQRPGTKAVQAVGQDAAAPVKKQENEDEDIAPEILAFLMDLQKDDEES